MMKLGNKLNEMKMRRTELYAILLQQTGTGNMSARRFEHICRHIHIITTKIKSFKGGLKNDNEEK